MTESRSFETFLARRERLAAGITEIASALAGIGGGGERARQLGEARDNLLNDAFRLMIVGEFKRGKSTLVNALLGQDVLPARVAPCTAILTEVRYGERPSAMLHFHDPERLPMPVAVDELKRYVVIEDGGDGDDDDDASEQIRESPYARLELCYPLALCKNNVQLVDSPGLNEHKTRTKVALDFLSKADALVLVLSCQQALSQSELAFIDNHLSGRNVHHAFFVWNHYDAIADSPDDIDDIHKRSNRYLLPRIKTRARIFYVSARGALLAKKRSDTAGFERSGFHPFEIALERFLATERGRVKLLTPLSMAEVAVREAVAELIPRAEDMATQPLDRLLKRYEEQRPKLDEAERQRDRLLRSIERRRDALVREVIASYLQFISDTELAVAGEVAKVEVTTWDAITSRRAAQRKVAAHLEGWLARRCEDWQNGDAARIFQAHASELEADIEERAKEFLANVDGIRRALAPSVGATRSEQDVSNANRVLAAVGGFIVGGVGSAIEGASMGFKGMAKGLATNITVSIGLLLLHVSLPIVFPVLVLVGATRVLWGAKDLVDGIRRGVASELISALRKSASEMTAAITSQITGEFGKLQATLDASLRIHIDEVASQVQTILKEKQQGEAQVSSERQRLAAARQALTAAAKRLEALRNEVDAPVES